MDVQSKAALESMRSGYVQYAFDEFKRLAASNDMAAQYYLGWCYENGVACEKALTDAFRLYRRAAERGLPDAMLRLASFYQNGIVVSQDDGRYSEWMERYQKKGGKCLLPDITEVYNGAQRNIANYALNPKQGGTVRQQPAASGGGTGQTVNHITIVQQTAPTPKPEQPKPTTPKPVVTKSDVDTGIPSTGAVNENTFALIIANEAYQNVAPVPNAINDGKVFADYCMKTLGMPKTNIHLVNNATYINIKRELNLMRQIAEAYKGGAKLVVYYAGHGLPDEASGDAYLLPVDGSGLTNLNASNIGSGTLSADRLATSGAKAGSYGPSANATLAYGAKFNVPYITVDDKGRVTAADTKTVTIPVSDNTDTHYTNYLLLYHLLPKIQLNP